MKSKAPLVLIEQVVMIVVFALTAAVCLRMFTMAELLSVKYAATDRAVLEAQNAAEALKGGRMDTYFSEHKAVGEEDVFMVLYDEDWNVTESIEKAEYYLQIILLDAESENLWKADIVVLAGEEELFRLTVAGQNTEVAEDDET